MGHGPLGRRGPDIGGQLGRQNMDTREKKNTCCASVNLQSSKADLEKRLRGWAVFAGQEERPGFDIIESDFIVFG